MDGVHIDLSNIDIVFHDGLMEKLTVHVWRSEE